MSRDRDVKETLLGQTRKLEATGDHQPDLDTLRREERGPDAVVPFSCTGCGMALSVNALGAGMLSDLAGDLGRRYAGKYFRVGRCIACADEFDEVTLEFIE